MGFWLAPCLALWDFKTDGWPPLPVSLPHSRDLLGLSCGWLYPCCGNGLMGFRLAPCLVLWDFKTDGWPPVPIPKPSPQPRPPWIEVRLALPMLRQWFDGISAGTLSGFMGFQNWRMAPCPDPKAFPTAETSLDWGAAGFTHAAAMVWWDFGWEPGISKLTDGPLSRSQSLPRLSCGWLYPCCGNGLMGFRLLVLWNFKTDGWPPVPIPKPSPHLRAHWIELRLALPMLRQWFDGISAGTLSGFMGFQNWRMVPCPDPKAFPTAETPLDWAAAGFTHAPAIILRALLSASRLRRLSLSHLPTFFRVWFPRRCQTHYLNSPRQTRWPHCCTARRTLMAIELLGLSCGWL